MSLTLTGAGSSSGSPPTPPPRQRIKRVSISGFRAFPPYRPSSFEVDLGAVGKNLLLYGENGSGKTSLFRALRDLCDTSAHDRTYAEHQNIFEQSADDAISIELTSGTPSEFRWEIGEEHPKKTQGDPFHTFARSCLFLDYRDLLETNFVHRSGSPNLYRLLVESILPDLPAPTRLLRFFHQALSTAKPTRHTTRQLNAAYFAGQNLKKALTVSLPEVVTLANRLLERLQNGTAIELTPSGAYNYDRAKRDFTGLDVRLSVTFNGQSIAEPQHFLNEARLTAIALAIYLAGARISRSGRSGIMILDDVLIGLDLSNRIPLLGLLSEEFAEWQVLLLTHDSTWFEMAVERLNENQWSFQRLHSAREPGTGRERPLHVIETEYLVRAEAFLQAGDYPAAGVYLRSKFEALLRTFAEEKRLQIPFKRELREINSEHLWPKAKTWQPRQNAAPLVSPALAKEIEFCRRFILNPLCHEAHGRPNRSEVELALAALRQLETALRMFSTWRTEWDQQHPKGHALPKHWRLALCEWLANKHPTPAILDQATAVRDAFAVGLENYVERHRASLAYTADTYATRLVLWNAAKAVGLLAAHASFVAIVDAEASWLLAEAPDDAVLAALTLTQIQSVFDALRDRTHGSSINCVLHQW